MYMYLCMFIYPEAERDEMQKLEERARQLAAESMADQPQQDKGILFVRLVYRSVSPKYITVTIVVGDCHGITCPYSYWINVILT